MNLVIAVSLATIAGILFYRVVERRHKVVLGKIGGVVASLAGAGILVLWLQERRSETRRQAIQRSVRIAFEPDSAYQARHASQNPFFALFPRNDTLTEISFRLCNTGVDTVTSVSFRPTTSRSRRSTEYDVVSSTGYSTYTDPRLSSDYVIAPQGCATLTWTASDQRRFVLLDSTSASDISVEAQSRP